MIFDFENTLRRLIIDVIGENDSAPYKISSERIDKWKEKREIELKKYKGILAETRIVFYSDFYDLKNIVIKNWELFKPILNDKKRFEVFFEELEKYRNSVAHGRIITSTQEFLIKGITADLKNLITIYHNKNEMKEDYFIRIIRVSDNLGNVWDDKSRPNEPTLRVGDNYELLIEANDPKDRKIHYNVRMSPSYGTFTFDEEKESNRFNITITEEMISPLNFFLITVQTPESEYSNHDFKELGVTVLP